MQGTVALQIIDSKFWVFMVKLPESTRTNHDNILHNAKYADWVYY